MTDLNNFSSRSGPDHDPANLLRPVRLIIVAAVLLAGVFSLAGAAFAQTGSPQSRAIFEQAKALHDGAGVQRDLDMARTLYRKAADMGSADACINLGYMYFTGEGAPQSYKASRLWYKTAADNGNRDAQRMMSVFYKNGLGVTADEKAAQAWIDRASAITPAPVLKPKVKKSAVNAPAPKPQDKPVARPAPAPPQPAAPVTKQAANAAPQAANTAATPAAVKPPKIKTPAATAAAKTPAQLPATKSQPRLIWLGLLSAASIALFGAIAVITGRYRAVKDVRDRQHFVAAFYARHRNILKSSYIAAQDHKGVIISNPQDPWVKAALNLMTRFAQKHEIITKSPMRLTTQVIRALATDKRGAEPILMPLMLAVEDILISDLNGNFDARPAKASAKDLLAAMLDRHMKNGTAATG